ncbi:hypothetical protein ACS49_01185 [Bacillus cereus]|nr:hypothetical protein ACS49_01185 [Bacillus cereus]
MAVDARVQLLALFLAHFPVRLVKFVAHAERLDQPHQKHGHQLDAEPLREMVLAGVCLVRRQLVEAVDDLVEQKHALIRVSVENLVYDV